MPPFKWTETHVTVVKLSSSITRADLENMRTMIPSTKKMREGEFMDWRVEFTYLNNFVKVVADYSCDNEEVFNRSVSVQCVG